MDFLWMDLKKGKVVISTTTEIGIKDNGRKTRKMAMVNICIKVLEILMKENG